MSEVKKKQVIALRPGLKFGRIIQEGEVFEVDIKEKSKWYRDLKASEEKKSADTNNDGKLGKEEILKWFEENQIEVDASLGVAKLREAYAVAFNTLNDPNSQQPE